MKMRFEDLISLIDCVTKGSVELVIGGFSDYDEVVKKLESGFHPKVDNGSFGYDLRPDNWLEIFHSDMKGQIDRHAVIDLSHQEYMRVKIAVLE